MDGVNNAPGLESKDEIYEEIYKRGFSFGKNWKEFLKKLNDERIKEAEDSLKEFLGDIKGKTFIDVGSGSGLFSLAAFNLGARVVSVDVDDSSIWCTEYMRKKYGSLDKWDIKKGSILDDSFVKSLGKFDVVYSWGVLHHTGNMKKAFENILKLVDDVLYIAIYNDNRRIFEGTSKFWKGFKKWYVKRSKVVQKIVQLLYRNYLYIGMIANRKNPFNYVKNYKSKRGMDFYSDIKDWLGGYPYEYMSMESLVNYFANNGLKLVKKKEARSIGCNEAVFRKVE